MSSKDFLKYLLKFFKFAIHCIAIKIITRMAIEQLEFKNFVAYQRMMVDL